MQKYLMKKPRLSQKFTDNYHSNLYSKSKQKKHYKYYKKQENRRFSLLQQFQPKKQKYNYYNYEFSFKYYDNGQKNQKNLKNQEIYQTPKNIKYSSKNSILNRSSQKYIKSQNIKFHSTLNTDQKNIKTIQNCQQQPQIEFKSNYLTKQFPSFKKIKSIKNLNINKYKQIQNYNNQKQLKKQLKQQKQQKILKNTNFIDQKNNKFIKFQRKTNLIIQQLRQTQDTLTVINNEKSKKLIKNISINDFIKIKTIGKGKNGQVILVIHKNTGFICAIKCIKKSQLSSTTIKQPAQQLIYKQLLNQIKIQSYISHPNIIQLYGYFHDSSNIYLIQQYGLNGQLYTLMNKKRKFNQQSTAVLSRQIIKGINQLHQKHIIHRDIKPQNIVLIYGIAKICDLGWAIYSPNQMRDTVCGTPLYLSPQILIGDYYNNKIDIWAFGILIYELFTGENPFKICHKRDLRKIITQQLILNTSLPHRLLNFISISLQKNIKYRASAKQLLIHKFLKKYQELDTSEQLINF